MMQVLVVVVQCDRRACTCKLCGGADISTAQAQFGSSSLDVTATNNSAVTAENAVLVLELETSPLKVGSLLKFLLICLDFRSNAASDVRLSLEETGGVT